MATKDWDALRSQQAVPIEPKGTNLQNVVESESYNEMESKMKRMFGGEYAAQKRFSDRYNPGGSTVPMGKDGETVK